MRNIGGAGPWLPVSGPSHTLVPFADWDRAVRDALAATFRSESRAEAEAQVEELVGLLGDPFTRVLRGGRADAFDLQRT